MEGEADRFELLKAVADEAQPVRFRVVQGSRWPDLIATDAIVLYLVSARFRKVLRDAGISGWHSRRVEVADVVSRDYELLVVTGRCGAIDDGCSVQSPRQNRSGVAYTVWTGLFFDPATWDGSDVFSPADSGLIFMTQRACDAIRRAKLRNVRLDYGPTFERLAL